MKLKLLTTIFAASLLTPLAINADEVRLTIDASAVGSTRSLALNAGVKATLAWGNGQTDTLTATGAPQSINVQNTALTITTSGTSDLTQLYMPAWELSAIELTNTPTLALLDVSFNNLTALEVSNTLTPHLKELNCRDNELTALTISGLKYIEVLDCANNNLTTLSANNVYTLESVIASGNALTNFTTTSTMLKTLWLNDNRLTALNTARYMRLANLMAHNNQIATFTHATMQDSLKHVWLDNNRLTKISLPTARQLNTISADDNRLDTLSLFATTGHALKNLYVMGNKLPFSQLPVVYQNRVLINSLIQPQDSFVVAEGLGVNQKLDITGLFQKNMLGTLISPTYKVKRVSDGSVLTSTEVTTIPRGTFTFKQAVGEVYIEVTSSTYFPGVTMVTKPFTVGTTSIHNARQSSAISLSVSRGMLTVTSPKALLLTVVNVAGQTVVNEEVAAGNTSFILPQGLYIVAGQKVIVP